LYLRREPASHRQMTCVVLLRQVGHRQDASTRRSGLCVEGSRRYGWESLLHLARFVVKKSMPACSAAGSVSSHRRRHLEQKRRTLRAAVAFIWHCQNQSESDWRSCVYRQPVNTSCSVPRVDGYQSGAKRAWELVSAIWNAVGAMGVAYALQPASFEHIGQKVRGPSQISDTGLATCLDLALPSFSSLIKSRRKLGYRCIRF
jgi:hypothetical protein